MKGKGFKKDLNTKPNNLFFKIIRTNLCSHVKEYITLIICESLIVAVTLSGVSSYQLIKNAHSYEMFMQEDGVSSIFRQAGIIFLLCALVLLITVVIAYLGERIPDYSMFRRLGITNSDFRKMVVFEAGVSYLASIVIGTIVGLAISFGFKSWVINRLDLGVELGKVSLLLYVAVYIATLFLYLLGFLLVMELEADFRLVTNTQETARIEKMVGRIPAVKIAVGLVLCIYSAFAYSELHNHESSVFILAFFIGLYLLCKNSIALHMRRVQKHNPKKYYKNLIKNNRFYFRFNTVSRYALFFSVVCFIGCFICGGQIIGTLAAQEPESLYPYDFVCLADNEDESFFDDLTRSYDVEIIEYPMVRVANIDKTEKTERYIDTAPQGQQIGISETTYHTLKKMQDSAYESSDLGLDENGDSVYIVHQQDTSIKAQQRHNLSTGNSEEKCQLFTLVYLVYGLMS